MKGAYHIAITIVLILVIQFLFPGTNSNAATIRQITFDKMIQDSQLVFDGQVIALKAREDAPKSIHTYVTFEIDKVIKGDYYQDTIVLRFLGGTVNGVSLAISDMKIPQLGEHGIYFVESLDSMQPNPLYGWSQGHFLLEPDATGTQRVFSNEKQPVTGLTGTMAAYQMNSAPGEIAAINKGVARGIIVTKEKNGAQGMTVDDFENFLREKVNSGQ